MIDEIRRQEYLWLKSTGLRPQLTHFVETHLQSCQHHDSNLVDVEHSRLDCPLDQGGLGNGGQGLDPFDPSGERKIAQIRGNKQTESLTRNVARFLVKALSRDPEYRAWMGDEYGDWGGIPTIKMARFWSVLKVRSSVQTGELMN
eukprot:SAG11_NODE_56_length_19295_cov_20.219675_11_plen_145_part_00